MRYINYEQLQQGIPKRTLIELSCDDPSARLPSRNVIEQVVNSAEELIDGYLRARYKLPLQPVPTIIRELVITLSRYNLYMRRPEGAMPDAIKDQYANAVKVLDNIQNGSITLGAVGFDAVPESGAIRVKASKKRFNDQVLSQWRN